MSDEPLAHLFMERFDRIERRLDTITEPLERRLDRVVDRLTGQNGRLAKLEIDRAVREKLERQAHEDDTLEAADVTASATRRAAWVGLWTLSIAAVLGSVVQAILIHWK